MNHDSTAHGRFVSWFRGAAPYINAHRGRVFVIAFGGEMVLDDGFDEFVHDIALLESIGVKLVLVHGARPQIEARLRRAGIDATLEDGIRVTSAASFERVKEAVGSVRVEVEATLSRGITNSPMHGARLRVVSGNFITAKPIGVRDGVDYEHTGEIRRIDADGIRDQLTRDAVVLVSPIGYSPTGEAFNLYAPEVATRIALALGAAKLVFMDEGVRVLEPDGAPVRQLTLNGARQAQSHGRKGDSLSRTAIERLRYAVDACAGGVDRVHVLDRLIDGALLLELFSRDGVGTMVSADGYESIRRASIDDVGGILELIRPLEEQGTLVRRSRERLEIEIERFVVAERDGAVVACTAAYPFAEERTMELACLAVHDAYRGDGLGEKLLERIELEASQASFDSLFVLTTRASDWFKERGFEDAALAVLPEKRQELYNLQRNSKVLLKRLRPR